MDFNLTKKNLQTWAADRMKLDKAAKHYDLEIFIMVEEETGDEYLTIKTGTDMKLIPLESQVPRRYSRASYDAYKKTVKPDAEIEEGY